MLDVGFLATIYRKLLVYVYILLEKVEVIWPLCTSTFFGELQIDYFVFVER